MDREDGTSTAAFDAATVAVRDLIAAANELAVRQARRLGTSVTDMRALTLLQEHGHLGASDLAHRLGISANATTALIDRLVRDGQVDRLVDPEDRRRVVVRPRREAQDRMRAAWLPSILDTEAIVHDLDPAERRAVLGFLHRITHSMNSHGH